MCGSSYRKHQAILRSCGLSLSYYQIWTYSDKIQGKVFYKSSCVRFFTRVRFCTRCTFLYMVYVFVHSVLFCTQCTLLYTVYFLWTKLYFLTLIGLPSLPLSLSLSSSSLHSHHLIQHSNSISLWPVTCYID